MDIYKTLTNTRLSLVNIFSTIDAAVYKDKVYFSVKYSS